MIMQWLSKIKNYEMEEKTNIDKSTRRYVRIDYEAFAP